jgi:hypothetical protein
MATKNLSPKLDILSAERELQLPMGVQEMGQSVGGVSAFSRVFKRGYGEDVFGVDEHGVWLGGADFDTAVVRQDYEGQVLIFDKDTGLARVLFGFQENGF